MIDLLSIRPLDDEELLFLTSKAQRAKSARMQLKVCDVLALLARLVEKEKK